MKKISMQLVISLLILISLTALSCSKDNAGKQNAPAKTSVDEKKEAFLMGVEESKKHVITKVNGAEITMNDLINRMNQMAPGYISERGQRTPELDRKLQEEALYDLIFRELAFQEAVRRGMKIQPEAVNKAIESLKINSGSEEAFKNKLKLIGETEESFKRAAEKDMLVDMITREEIFQKIKVDEKQIKAVYMKDKTKFVHPEAIDLEDVVVIKSKDSAADMKKADELLAAIRKNNNDVSRLPHDKAFIVREGGLSKEEYPNIYKAASGLKIGDLSGVIAEDDGLHIVKVTGKIAARQMTYEDAHPVIEKKLKDIIANKLRQKWGAKLKKNASIEISLQVKDDTDQGKQ